MSPTASSPTNESPLASLLSPELAAALQKELGEPTAAAPAEASPAGIAPPPPEPATLAEAGLTAAFVDSHLMKCLLQAVNASGSELASRSCLSRSIVGESLGRLRDDLMVTIKGQTATNDYVYQLTEAGHARAQQLTDYASYSDAAPVTLAAYERSVNAQSLSGSRMTIDRLRRALGKLIVADDMASLLAQAVSDGKGLFLFGAPGNGKTTLAEHLCAAFGKYLWIPRAVITGDDILRVYDESVHVPVETERLRGVRHDRRWVLIERPTVVVGGELTLAGLDPSHNPTSGISEAPVQMKANGGVLVIDDFGRQRVSPTELLNRLIVPLEKSHDYLSLASGRQVRTPFEMLCVLSTNLEPRELVDEAFLRRIPYKVEVIDPTLEQFRQLFAHYSKPMGIGIAPGAVERLIAKHYEPSGRALRFCHPRDLLRQAKNYCDVHERPAVADDESLGAAAENYFAGL